MLFAFTLILSKCAASFKKKYNTKRNPKSTPADCAHLHTQTYIYTRVCVRVCLWGNPRVPRRPSCRKEGNKFPQDSIINQLLPRKVHKFCSPFLPHSRALLYWRLCPLCFDVKPLWTHQDKNSITNTEYLQANNAGNVPVGLCVWAH